MEPVTIDDLDRRIIQALYVDPRAPFSRLSDVLGSSEQTIARRYRRLFDGHVVRVVGQLDSQRLGRSDWAVRIRCAPGSAPAVATKLARASRHRLGAADLGGNRDLQHDPLPRPRTSEPRYCSASSRSAVRSSPSRRTASSTCSPPGSAAASGSQRPQPERDRPAPLAAATRTPIERRPSRCRTPTGPSSRPSPKTAAPPTGSWRRGPTGTSRRSGDESRSSSPRASSSSTSISPPTPSESDSRRCCGCRWFPPSSPRSDRRWRIAPRSPSLPPRPGPTNLVAALVCQDDHSLYEYITGEMAALDGHHPYRNRPRDAGRQDARHRHPFPRES